MKYTREQTATIYRISGFSFIYFDAFLVLCYYSLSYKVLLRFQNVWEGLKGVL